MIFLGDIGGGARRGPWLLDFLDGRLHDVLRGGCSVIIAGDVGGIWEDLDVLDVLESLDILELSEQELLVSETI
jgi:uncharacterized protein with von Willebrand factor type A (vWA) domain